MKSSRKIHKNPNLGICNYEDEIIRGQFKNYNKSMSSIIDEHKKFSSPSNCDGSVFCGWFVARIYVGDRFVGKYKFDCTEYDTPRFVGYEDMHVTKVG